MVHQEQQRLQASDPDLLKTINGIQVNTKPDHLMQFAASAEQRCTWNLEWNSEHLSDPLLIFVGESHLITTR
jgi:hypothetical protein